MRVFGDEREFEFVVVVWLMIGVVWFFGGVVNWVKVEFVNDSGGYLSDGLR